MAVCRQYVVLRSLLDNDATVGHAILLYGGETPVEEALQLAG